MTGLVVLAALLFSQVALAQRVVVLEFSGDKKNKLRTQVESALKKAGVVEIVSVAQYKRATAKKKVKGARAMGPAGVKAVAKWIKLDAAVEGAIGDTFLVRILDPSGAELWSKDLPISRGAISADNARRLAKAIAAAAQAGLDARAANKGGGDEKEEPPPDEGGDEKGEETSEKTEETTPEKTEEKGEGEAKQEEKVVTLPEVSVDEPAKVTTPEEREEKQREQLAESSTIIDPNAAREQEQVRDEDLEEERKKKKVRRGPRLLQVQVVGTITWRSYCARPGVLNCKDFDDLPEDQQPGGVTVNFSAQFPYMGAMFGVELFPLATVTDGPANGFGLSGYFGRGFSLARVRSESDVDNTEPREVIALDDAFFGGAHYRFHFLLGEDKAPLVGYVGVKGGFMGRTFEVDPNANSPLPGSHRAYPMVGLEFSVPLIPLVKIEGAGHYFVGPRAGIDEIAAFGSDATGSGFGFEIGFAGDVWGPIGYVAKMRFARYKDDFTGEGGKWLSGGAAEESYATTVIGVTASF